MNADMFCLITDLRKSGLDPNFARMPLCQPFLQSIVRQQHDKEHLFKASREPRSPVHTSGLGPSWCIDSATVPIHCLFVFFVFRFAAVVWIQSPYQVCPDVRPMMQNSKKGWPPYCSTLQLWRTGGWPHNLQMRPQQAICKQRPCAAVAIESFMCKQILHLVPQA